MDYCISFNWYCKDYFLKIDNKHNELFFIILLSFFPFLFAKLHNRMPLIWKFLQVVR